MTELITLPGQIMHSSTAEKLIQPAEQNPEQAAQQAALAAAKDIEENRRKVRQSESKEYGRVEGKESSERESSGRRRRQEEPEEAEEAGRETQGRVIDVVV